jgi:Tfp pilus assembly protein PilP
MTRLLSTLALACWLGAAVASAQAPATPAPAPAPAAAPADNLPSPAADYSYTTAGRRDPFMTLTRPGKSVADVTPTSRRAGAAGILVDELTVRGIVLSNGNYVAMVSGPGTGQTYSVRAGSRLADGTVQSITPRAVVILQQVSDPLSLEKQREVRKLLRTQEEGK